MSKNSEKRGILTWMKDYPIKTMIIVFVLLVIFFAAIIFGSLVRNNKKFYFENNSNASEIKYLYQSDLNKAKEFEEYLKFDSVNVTFTKSDRQSDYEFFGSYYFDINYTQKSDRDISFKMFLKSDWTDKQTSPSTVSPNNAKNKITRTITYDYEKDFKTSKYLFFKVSKPALYIEITVKKTDSSSGLPSETKEIFYYRYDFTINNIAN